MNGKVIILGSKGMLGGQLMKVFGNEAIGWDREDVDVTDINQLTAKLSACDIKPSVILNCVAYNDVDGAEDNKELAFKLNGEVPNNLAKICKDNNITLVHFSTNYVFNGQKHGYEESDLPKPLSVYGHSKLAGETAVRELCPNSYLIRTSVIFGPKGQSNLSKKSFVEIMVSKSAMDDEIRLVADEINSLTYSPDLAAAVKVLLEEQKPFGIYHITNSGMASWFDFGKEIFLQLKKPVKLKEITGSSLKRLAKRPKNAVLVNTKLKGLRSWQEALKEFLSSNF